VNTVPIKVDMRFNYIVWLIFCGLLVCGYELVKVLEDTFPPLMMSAVLSQTL